MDKKKKNLLIGGLLAVVLLLAVGYAAFATTLNITGSSTIDSRWDIHIKNGGVNPDPNNTVAAESVTATKVNDLTGSFSCNLTTPGISTIDYIIEVENTGTFGAQLSSINITGETAFIGTSLSKSSLTQGEVIAAGGSDTVTVTVSYKDVDIVPTLQADKQVAIIVALNFVQDDGSAVATSGGNEQTVYSWNTTAIAVGTSQLTDLVSTKTAQPYYTSESAIQNALSGKTNSTFYNKYTVVGNIITEGYACQTFGVLNNAKCLKMSTDGSTYGYDEGENYTGNAEILNALNSNSIFTGALGYCDFTSFYPWLYCGVGNLNLMTGDDGSVDADNQSPYSYCSISSAGNAICTE